MTDDLDYNIGIEVGSVNHEQVPFEFNAERLIIRLCVNWIKPKIDIPS
jgi:hypothetical protein